MRNIKLSQETIQNETSTASLHFPRSANLHIYTQDSAHKILADDELTVSLPEPILAFSQPFLIDKRKAWGSGTPYSACVLPGVDPRGGPKPCQDLVFIEAYKGMVLAGVFDGHGPRGEDVVSFCKQFVHDFWLRHDVAETQEPGQYLVRLVEACDKSLSDVESEVNCKCSGSTAVLMLYFQGQLHFASVGDSRAVMGTLNPPDIQAAHQPPRGEDKALLDQLKAKRQITPDKVLSAVQLTTDQKPEDPYELERIKQFGGVVMRLEDDNGHKVGPYRVWKVENVYPGIAMSRSIGDSLAHEIGVISTPITSSRVVDPTEDYFIVIGSDGLWDVMENQEVCDFVEAFRFKSVRNSELAKSHDVVEPSNVTIAQLLCEEARARWLSIVEAEDVLIDDISCTILELQVSNRAGHKAPERTSVLRKEIQDVAGLEKALKRSGTRIRDPLREQVTEEVPVASAMMLEGVIDQSPVPIKDPRRSSVTEIPVGAFT